MFILLSKLALAQQAPPMVNGTRTDEHPQVGSLVQYYEGVGGGSFCSGTLIHPGWVLTAAHCVVAAQDARRQGWGILFYMAPDVYDSSGVLAYAEAKSFEIHPGYDPENISAGTDLGLIELETEITLVPPMAVNTDPIEGWIGEEITFLGYGITSDEGSGGGVKRVTHIPVFDTSTTVLYAYDSKQNLCSGDSGGGGLRIDPVTGAWEIVSVNSFVFAYQNATPCVGGASGSARVDVGMEWIEGFVPLDEVGFDAPALPVNDPGRVDTADPRDPYANGLSAEPIGGCSQASQSGGLAGGLAGMLALSLGLMVLRRRA